MAKETKYDVYQHGHEIPIMTNATLEQAESKMKRNQALGRKTFIKIKNK
jgi:hypothetical protein|tara:strand:- start:441 stop:587 length:147 start_codon:yes stop_codon:yes gene_type:complete